MKRLLAVLGVIIVVILAGILVLLFMIRSRTAPKGGEPPAVSLPVTGATINIFDGDLDLKNFTLTNPSGFEGRTFISIPEIYVSIDTGTIAGPQVKHVREARINIAEITAIRRKDRKYNFEWILHQKKVQAKVSEKAAQNKLRYRIDKLRFTFGHVIFLDYTVRGDKPFFVRFDIDLDKTYTGISDLEALGKSVSKDILDKVSIGDIRNFEVKDLPDISRSALAAIPDDTKDRIFGTGKDRDRVIKELSHRFANKVKGK